MSKCKIDLLSWMCVWFYSSFVCISACANVYSRTFNQYSCVRGPLRECRSIRSGASRLPYYCAPLVCVSGVIELLAVWWHNKPKTKKTKYCETHRQRATRFPSTFNITTRFPLLQPRRTFPLNEPPTFKYLGLTLDPYLRMLKA